MNIGPILVVTGALPAGAGIGLLVPRQLLEFLLGKKIEDPTTILMGRHWSLLGALVGGLLIYAGYQAEIRVPVLIVGAAEKLTFFILLVTSPLRARLLTMLVASADGVMALVYLLFLAQYRPAGPFP